MLWFAQRKTLQDSHASGGRHPDVQARRDAAALAKTQPPEKVKDAISAGRMPPALREWVFVFCRSVRAGVEAFRSKSSAGYASVSQSRVTANQPVP
ncbi:MAG: hypothetical protein ACK4GW_16655 [Pseudorhodobacter sp.]